MVMTGGGPLGHYGHGCTCQCARVGTSDTIHTTAVPLYYKFFAGLSLGTALL